MAQRSVHKDNSLNIRISLYLIIPVLLLGLFSGAMAAGSSETEGALPTAKANLAAATAEAKKWQADAVLIMVETSTAKPDGSAYSWLYVYNSPKGGNMISIMIDDEGEVSQFPGVSAFRKPISDFVDSDQAMAAAVEAGLKTHDFGMTMSLKNADRAEWSIPGSEVVYSIDAVTGKFLSKE